jgi:antitoxin HicB
MRFAWPVDVLEERDGITITCPDVPEMVTCGATLDAAMEDATDALVTALSFYTDAGRRLPIPSPARGRRVVTVPALTAAKLALHQAMLDAGVSNVALGRRLGVDEKAVRRLRDPLHRSKVETIEVALRALGQRLEVVVRPAA